MTEFGRFLFRVEHLIGRDLRGFELPLALAAFDAGASADEHALLRQSTDGHDGCAADAGLREPPSRKRALR